MNDFVMELNGVSKSFPGVKALDKISFNLKKGEVHALLGENGAGKSTLMKIISGSYTRDEGTFLIDGKSFNDLSPKKAQELGIAIIHQELNLCSHLSVAENIFLGREETKFGVIDEKYIINKSREILDELKINLDPETIVGKLSVSKQQMVEIAKALSTKARILIMDEPTSALTDKEINELFDIVNRLKKNGCSIIYISHRLEELVHITDRYSVFRDGKYIITKDYKESSIDEIISYMVGREITNKFPHIEMGKGKEILEVKNLNAGIVKDVSFKLYDGEIIGFAGLMGAGRSELVRALFGVDKIESGEIILMGEKVDIVSPQNAIKNGIVLGPEDRRREGLCGKLSIIENIGLANLDHICNSFGIVNSKKELEMASKVIDNLKVKTPSVNQLAEKLSGGNQQKIVVGKWLVRNAKVVIFDEPTRGIDVAAKVEIYNIMNDLKKKGIGVIFVSSELPEVMGMSDRIIVMCNGKISGEVLAKDATQNEIMHLATQFN